MSDTVDSVFLKYNLIIQNTLGFNNIIKFWKSSSIIMKSSPETWITPLPCIKTFYFSTLSMHKNPCWNFPLLFERQHAYMYLESQLNKTMKLISSSLINWIMIVCWLCTYKYTKRWSNSKIKNIWKKWKVTTKLVLKNF